MQMKEDLTQASIEPLLNYFDRLIPLDKEEKKLIKQKFHSRRYESYADMEMNNWITMRIEITDA